MNSTRGTTRFVAVVFSVLLVTSAVGAGVLASVGVVRAQQAGGESSGNASNVVFAVNAGGSEYTASDGTVYQADINFDKGTASTANLPSDQEINSTENDLLYRTERYGDPFSYNIPVENGDYQVTLKFAEIYQGVSSNDKPDSAGPDDGTNENDRVFNASIESEQVLTNYDLFAEVGPLNATQETFATNVSDGTLNIDFEGTIAMAKVSAIKVVEVQSENQPPTANIAVNETSLTAGDTVAFDANGSSDGDGIVQSYGWDFDGDNVTDATGQSVAHTFDAAGDYDVTLTVTDDDGATATDAVNVTVQPIVTQPNVSIAQTATGSTTVSAGETTSFEMTINYSDINAPAINATLPAGWNVVNHTDDDGAYGPPQPAWVWQEADSDGVAGSHTVTYVVEIPASAAPGEYTISAVGSGINPANGSSVAQTDDLTVTAKEQNQQPSAAFSVVTSAPKAGQAVSFDASASSDTDGSITSYAWDFDGDNVTDATGQSVAHTFDAAGDYDVTLAVTDDDGATVNQTQTVSVAEAASGDLTIAQAVAQHGDGDDTTIGTQEISQAINWWATGSEVPDTGGQTIDTQTVSQLVNTWATGETVTQPDQGATGSALVEVTPDSGNIDQSTYGHGSYQVTNTGEKNITSVSFDLSTASMPDMVFDPQGTAGDPTGEGFNIASDGGTGITTAETTDGDYSAFSQPHNGQNAADGYDVMTVEFDDFQSGETATFWADNDPTSVKGATVGSQEAGPVSGLELARSTVTVTYEDGTTQTTQLMGDGSDGGATAVVNGSEASAPSIGAQNVSLDGGVLNGYHSGATVSQTGQTITVSGQPGETITLVQVEGELALSNVPNGGYDVEDLEANNAVDIQYHTVTLDSNGEATVPVTPTSSADDSDDAGYNYFVAAHGEASGDMGLASNVVVLKYDASAGDGAGTSSANFAVNANSGTDASTYGGGSFEITNTGDKQISSVTYDLNTSTFPDVVFDPEGTAGDSAAKGFTPSSGETATGLVEGSFATPHNGQDGADGYDELTATFDDFGNGETFAFSTDIDPTSIKNAQGTGAAGSVSGLELSGATVTVEYADGTTQTTNLFGDGSNGGSQATTKADVAAAPTLGAEGVSLDASALDSQHSAATVSQAGQTVTVSGPAGATVEMLHVEGQLELANQADGYDLEQFEANTAENVDYQTVQLDSSGQATVDVTLINTSSNGVEGGFNYFVAVVKDGSGDTGATSNMVVLKYDESAGSDDGSSTQQVLYRVNAGGDTVSAVDDGPDWTGVTGTGSQYLASVGPNGGNYDGGADVTTDSTVPPSTPDAVFDDERYGEMTWEFSVDSGEQVDVRLYMANSFSGTSEPGQRQFNVSVEGQQVLTQYDPVADVGHAIGTLKNFTVTDDGDGTVTVTFEKGAVENPEVRAIEILGTEDGSQ